MGTLQRAQRKPVAALSKLTAGALAGVALVALMSLLIGEFIPLVAVIAGLALLFAGMIMVGWRWAPILATVLSSAVLAMFGSIMVYDLAHPEELTFFAVMLVTLTMLLAAIIGGVAATVQNYRHAAADRRAPRGLALAVATTALTSTK